MAVKATAPADLRASPGRSEALLNAIAASTRMRCEGMPAGLALRYCLACRGPLPARSVNAVWVSLGSKAALTASKWDFCYTLESRLNSDIQAKALPLLF